MSALPPKPDIRYHDQHVRFVPKADIQNRSEGSEGQGVSTSRHALRSWVRRPNKYHGIFGSTVSSPLLIHLFSTGTSWTCAPADAGQSKSSSLAGPSTELGLPQSGRHNFGPLECCLTFRKHDSLSFSSSEGPSNAHIGRSILPRAVITSRRRYWEPEGRQWQIDLCHAHHCRAA